MLLSIIFELKNKEKYKKDTSKTSNNEDSKAKDSSFSEKGESIEDELKKMDEFSKKIEKEEDSSEEKQKKESYKKRRKEARKRSSLFYKEDDGDKNLFKIGFSFFQIFIVAIVFIILLIRLISLGFDTGYTLSGTLQPYSDNKVLFVPDITSYSKYDINKDLEIGDIIYFRYNETSNEWVYTTKKTGLKLKVVSKNNYQYKFTILNLKNIVLEKDVLSSYGFSTNGEVVLPLRKHSNTYAIYFELNDYINSARKKYNIQNTTFTDFLGDIKEKL